MSFRNTKATHLIIALVALTALGDLYALAQEGAAPQLPRVDVEAPARRTRSSEAEFTRSADYDDAMTPDQPASEPRDASTRWGTAFGPNMPALSVITDKSALSISSASLPSQVSVVTRQEIDRLDVRNYSDLFRQVPGVRSFTYGMGDIGHVIQIRGFQGGHGTDTGVFVDGVPQNFPSAAVGINGASDISWLAPEIIERIEVIKGPFSALYGNHTQAGAINIITKNTDSSPSLMLSGASFGGFRCVPIVSSDSWYPTPFLAAEYLTLDGYRDNSQYKRASSFNKGTVQLWNGYLSLRFNYYWSNWGRPGYLPINDVRKGIIDRRSAVDPTDGGDQHRWALVMNYSPAIGECGLYFTAYLEDYDKNAFAMAKPYAQQWSRDDRVFWGGRVFYNYLFGNFAALTVGAESRYDTGPGQKFKTVSRVPTSKVSDYDLGLLNRAWFVQVQIKPTDSLKFVGGLRGDYFDYGADNNVKPANSGRGYPYILSPKLGLVITPIKNVNLFGNKGLGFRAPSIDDMSPVTTTGRKNFDLECAKTDSWDIGFNATLFSSIYLAVSYYRTDMEKEVRTVDYQPINIGDTRRNGYEVEARFYPSNQINLFANYAWVDARVKNPANAGQDKVAGVSEDVVKAGIQLTLDLAQDIKLLGDVYLEYTSGVPYYFGTSAQPVYGPDYNSYNFRLAWQGRNWGLFLAALYQPREYSSDTIWYENNKLVFNPLPLWNLNAGLKYSF